MTALAHPVAMPANRQRILATDAGRCWQMPYTCGISTWENILASASFVEREDGLHTIKPGPGRLRQQDKERRRRGKTTAALSAVPVGE